MTVVPFARKALPTMEFLTWLGVTACLVQSAMFSGLNLALFGVGRLQLEVEAARLFFGMPPATVDSMSTAAQRRRR